VVARIDSGTAEPPFVAAEDHVRARNVAHDGGTGPVADVAADGERLRGHDAAEGRPIRVLVVVVERVGVLHPLHPPANVGDGDRLLQLTTSHRLADVPVDIARVELDLLVELSHWTTSCFGILTHTSWSRTGLPITPTPATKRRMAASAAISVTG
jgi:hypothetical protein